MTAGDRPPGWRWQAVLGMYAGLAAGLVAPASDIVDGRDGHAALAALALAAFVALYAPLVWLAFTRPETVRAGALLAGLVALTAVLVLVYAGHWWVLLVFLTAASSVTLAPGPAVAAIVFAVALAAALAEADRRISGDLFSLVIGVALAGLTGLFVRRFVTLIGELRELRDDLARLAVAEERLRIARDLHDLLGHSLSLIVLKAAVARELAHRDPDAVAREARQIEDVGRRALWEVREAVTGYRQPRLATELHAARDALAAADIAARLPDVTARPSARAEALLGWAVREGVTNVIRHSGARRCTITLHARDGHLVLHVDDDGAGTANGAPSAGHGLRGLGERVTAVGGSLRAGPRPDGGFRLTITVPLEPAEVRA